MCGFALQLPTQTPASKCALFLTEVLNVQSTTSTVFAFGSDYRAATAGADPWWRSDDYYALAGPFLALIAGILILIVPRILN